MYTLFYHARQIVTCPSSTDLGILTSDDIDGLAVCTSKQGNIIEIGTTKALWRKYEYVKYHDCFSGSLVPGFVDAHTHPVWEGDRVHEFAMKLAGASYMDIHNSGGGIHYSVKVTTEASEKQLYRSLTTRLSDMASSGTTTVECKTGYGLLWETELKMLRVLTRAKRELPLDISITFLAAHAVPNGSTAEDHANDIVHNQIPRLQQLIEAGEILCDNIDVFCEKGIFELKETQSIVEAGKRIGLSINVHSDELNNIGGTELLSVLGARALSHLEELSDQGILAMKTNKVTGVLLPSTAYLLHLRSPPVRNMICQGVRCALGSDFNPNAHCLCMPTIMNLACVQFGMTMPEALLASTINGAHSIGLQHRLGSIEIGKQADFVLLKEPNWEHLIYQISAASSLIRMVVKKGVPINVNSLT